MKRITRAYLATLIEGSQEYIRWLETTQADLLMACKQFADEWEHNDPDILDLAVEHARIAIAKAEKI